MNLTIFTDGGGQSGDDVGGAAAAAYVAEVEGEYFGSRSVQLTGTNNDAEYTGVVLAMRDLTHEVMGPISNFTKITFVADSQLIVNQIAGLWKCKAERLRAHRDEIRDRANLMACEVEFTWQRREFNKAADRLCAVTMVHGNKTEFTAPIPPDPRRKVKLAKQEKLVEKRKAAMSTTNSVPEVTEEKRMTLLELLNMANEAYGDGAMQLYYDEETAATVDASMSDGLARFIVIELSETFEPDATRDEQVSTACGAIDSAIKQLNCVYNAIG